MRRLNPITRHIDGVVILLTTIAIVIFALFGYLQKIDSDIEHYQVQQRTLDNLAEFDQQMNNTFLRVYRSVNYDAISRSTQQVEGYFAQLHLDNFQSSVAKQYRKMIRRIRMLYATKLELFEEFKSYNSRAVNAIYYLHDLRKTIDLKEKNADSIHGLIDQIFFKISQVYIDVSVDALQFEKDITVLSENANRGLFFKQFYLHVKRFYADARELQVIQKQNEALALRSSIADAQQFLHQHYTFNQTIQRAIAVLFFLLSFIILIALFFLYFNIRKTNRELMAFRYAVENSDNVMVVTDAERRIEYVNDAFEARTGYSKEEVMGKNPNIISSHIQDRTFYQEMNAILDRGEKWHGEFINRHKDGALVYEKASITPIIIDGKLVQYLAIKLDTTEYIMQQKRLQQAATVFEMLGDGVIITDAEKKIIMANPAYTKMFECSQEEVMGQEPGIIASLKGENAFAYERLLETLMATDRWVGRAKAHTKSGEPIPVWLTVSVVRDMQGEIQNFIAIFTDLRQIMKMEERANYLAYHDSLTGLPNRVQFEREIIEIFLVARSRQSQVAVLFIDLDRFKVINDTLGHTIGDEMLKELAIRLRAVMPPGDLLARIGGDEFVAVVSFDAMSEIEVIAEKLLAAVREPIDIRGYHLNTSASIGAAIYPQDGADSKTIMKHADSAMYHAKEHGKNNYQFYTEQISIDVQMRLYYEQELKNAISNGELSLVYQPQYDLLSGKIVAAEVLLRWQNERLGKVSPEQFIPIAEDTGMIVEIGEFVLEEACRTFMQWRKQGCLLDRIAVNISSVQFRQEEMLERFQNIMAKSGIAPANIEIEITERHVMEYSESNLTTLEDLRRMGCTISIDDFGTGYSSMSYLKSLEVDMIKIDKSFVMDLPGNTHDIEVSKAIIALSKSLGYRVVAEGIESEEQEEFLRQNGCHYGQGYHFSPPLTPEAFYEFAKRHAD